MKKLVYVFCEKVDRNYFILQDEEKNIFWIFDAAKYALISFYHHRNSPQFVKWRIKAEYIFCAFLCNILDTLSSRGFH